MSHTEQTRKDGQAVEKLGRKRYRRELARLQGELVRLQEWVVREGIKVCIVFEGRDTAGKGGVIKRITERVSPRVFRVVALPAPTDREKSQMYVQRYLSHFPAAGEIVIFDRNGTPGRRRAGDGLYQACRTKARPGSTRPRQSSATRPSPAARAAKHGPASARAQCRSSAYSGTTLPPLR